MYKWDGISMIIAGVLTAAGVYLEVTAAQVVFLILGFLAVPFFVHVPLAVVPVWWVSKAGWKWRLAGAVPAASVVLIYTGLMFSEFGLVPLDAMSNLGPLMIAAVWACFYLVDVGLLIAFSPDPAAPLI